MERVTNPETFDFKTLETLMENLENDHSSTTLNKVKNSLNAFFIKSSCKEIIFTRNTDKLFFGMRVYPVMDGNKALEIIGDRDPKILTGYYLEFDSKLFDPMLYMTGSELVALLLHEIGHIVYDTDNLYLVKNAIDLYFSKSGGYIDLKSSAGFKELLAYGMKDSIMKAGSIFTKFGNTELVADQFVISCGYGPELESAMKKIVLNIHYMSKDIDDRFITLTWVLRVGREFSLFRIPAVKTLNKAIKLTGSKLEKRELKYASDVVATMEEPISESAWDNLKDKFSAKFMAYKRNGVKAIKNDVFELNLRLRTAEDVDELMSIIRSANSSISILQEYLTEDISDKEREEVVAVLEELYSIREKASKHKEVQSRYSGYIQVVYPSIN